MGLPSGDLPRHLRHPEYSGSIVGRDRLGILVSVSISSAVRSLIADSKAMSRSKPQDQGADTSTPVRLDSWLEPSDWSGDCQEAVRSTHYLQNRCGRGTEKEEVKSQEPKSIAEVCTGSPLQLPTLVASIAEIGDEEIQRRLHTPRWRMTWQESNADVYNLYSMAEYAFACRCDYCTLPWHCTGIVTPLFTGCSSFFVCFSLTTDVALGRAG